MALISLGPFITDAWGSIGGVTFGKAQGMNIAKRKPVPRKRVIPKRVKRWCRFSEAIYTWKTTLTAGNKQDWIDAAALFVQSRHGIAYEISGLNLYVAHRTLMEDAGQAPIAAPTVFTGRLATPAVTWAWNPGVAKLRGSYGAPGVGNSVLFWNSDGTRPGATVKKIPLPNFQVVAGGLGTVDLVAVYTPSPGTCFIHWIAVDHAGSLSTCADTYESYP